MKKQSGFTLIELMIASLIGIFLVTAIINLFITVNRTVTLGDALSKNQETGRFAMNYLTRFIRNAGYTENRTLSPPVLLIQNSNPDFLITCTAGTAEADACASNNPDAGKTDANKAVLGDRLSIVYVATDATKSCSGQDVGGATEQKIADVFWVSNTTDNKRELRCRTYSIDDNNWLVPNGAAVSIVNNVETLEFQVGLAASEKEKSAARYVSVDQVITDKANKYIRSIRVAILTTSTDELDTNRVQAKKTTRNYGVLDASLDDLSFNDGNLRNLFISTIELPGAIEGAILN